jgi:hypothetical protein
MKSFVSFSLAALSFTASSVRAASIAEQVKDLRLAPTEVDRLNVLEDSQVNCSSIAQGRD